MRKKEKLKLTILGGGGVRSPYLAKSIALAAEELSIGEVVYQDIDEKKLHTYGGIALAVSHAIAPELKVSLCLDAEKALAGADYIITTIRAEGDEGRVIDERTALSLGVLGQETTGAGGFAMALRSIPVLTGYCELIRKVSADGAVVFNFTNPSGLVTQALRSKGYDMVYGVCDAPSGFFRQLKGLLPKGEFRGDCFGLNHLSWFRNCKLDGRDVTEDLLSDPRLYRDTEMRLFSPDILTITGGCMPNEYLYFYYYREKAAEAIMKAGMTRGETIQRINADMEKELDGMSLDAEFDQAFECYMRHYAMREDSYFAIESGARREKKWNTPDFKQFIAQPDGGGYAGVALDFIRAVQKGISYDMVLSVPNEGVLPFLEPEDVAELSCTVSQDGVQVREVGQVAPLPELLIRTVKRYEKLTSEAIAERSFQKAVQALTVHPLVNSYSLAAKLAEEYGTAYGSYFGGWADGT